nr:hypothetical protein [Pseudomonas aeruginosa]
MLKPDASNHNPDPRYLRGLLKKAGISQRRAAELLGLGDRVMRYYLSEDVKEGYRPRRIPSSSPGVPCERPAICVIT